MFNILKLSPKKVFLIILLFIIKGSAFAQSLNFNIETAPLVFEYASESDFNIARTIPKAFTLRINNSKKGSYNIFCRLMVSSGQNFGEIPLNAFSLKLNSTNFSTSGLSFQNINMGLSDISVATVSNRSRQSDVLYYDLVLNPIGLSFNPDNYNYSFIFTVTEN